MTPQVHQVRLAITPDRLDRPEDGYCLDIPGPPQNLFLQLPLFAHNCSPSLKIDTAVEFTSEGFIKFPRVDRCVTVAGVKTALPGSSIMLSECNPSNFVIDISVRQRFTHRDDGSLALSGTELCLAMGLDQRKPSPLSIVGALYLSMIAPQQSPPGPDGSSWFLTAEPDSGYRIVATGSFSITGALYFSRTSAATIRCPFMMRWTAPPTASQCADPQHLWPDCQSYISCY